MDRLLFPTLIVFWLTHSHQSESKGYFAALKVSPQALKSQVDVDIGISNADSLCAILAAKMGHYAAR